MLPLPIAVQENHHSNISESRTNNLELNIHEVVQSLQIGMHKMTEKVDKLTARMNEVEIKLTT